MVHRGNSRAQFRGVGTGSSYGPDRGIRVPPTAADIREREQAAAERGPSEYEQRVAEFEESQAEIAAERAAKPWWKC